MMFITQQDRGMTMLELEERKRVGKLAVKIVDKETGEVVAVEWVDDPRKAFCETYNQMMPDRIAISAE
jgi:uncharacterized FlaG/YvyC family protein